ncbi:hypothetical protein J2S43_005525 [Catenuloplanes nepalensis]|uniref:Uncharacterized protein n=1 Tax=Catenuloplanes nepalensis TaxID=587533 RepID=A0ABT9N0J8_9ACTN|nr:hypothetical protein [Catenuloplanes nepalensis]
MNFSRHCHRFAPVSVECLLTTVTIRCSRSAVWRFRTPVQLP